MTISAMWKNEMGDILEMIYRGKMDRTKIDIYLDKVISSKENNFPIMQMRNLYTKENFNIPFNTIFDTIHNENLCIGSNGTLTYSYKKIKTPIPDLLIKMKKDRKMYKGEALKMEEKIGACKKACLPIDPKDEMQLKYFDNIQTKVKQDMNSFYGVQSLKTSFIYNPDTASMITAQARQMISEMMWSIERFLGGNTQFDSISELFTYLNLMLKESHDSSEFDSFVSYIPTKEDIFDRITELLNYVPNYKQSVDNVNISLYHFICSLTERQRVYIYYKNNLNIFLIRNPVAFKILDDIISSDIEFMNPAMNKFERYAEDYEKMHAKKLDENERIILKQNFDKLTTSLVVITNILKEFVICHITTPNRVNKYMTKNRKNIIISDTDSIIINLDPWVRLCNSLISKPFDSFEDDTSNFKVINIATYLCTEITKIAGKLYCINCNIPEELYGFVEMKNEFLFKRVILYKNVKKNYVAHTRLREGNFVDKISSTGIKLRGSSINHDVQKQTNSLIENKILRSKVIDPVAILTGIKEIEESIKLRIKAGDKSFGKRCRYSGPDGYKTGVYQNAAGRGSLIWNIINPNDEINVGEYGYMFKTIVHTIEDIEVIKDIDESVYRKIKDKIFADENLRKYGLSVICIPIDNDRPIPEWIIKIIDVDDLISKQIQPLTSLMPSIGIYNSRISATKNKISSIISF